MIDKVVAEIEYRIKDHEKAIILREARIAELKHLRKVIEVESKN